MAVEQEPKKIAHTIILDTGAIIKNEPPVSTLLGQFEEIVTVPAILSEIRDATTRNRVDLTLRPFLKIRSPKPDSIKFVVAFARRTGDLAVLSRPDIEIIALAYELECERNGGDWRLRNAPGQKGLNGSPPVKSDQDVIATEAPDSINPQIPPPASLDAAGENENTASLTEEIKENNRKAVTISNDAEISTTTANESDRLPTDPSDALQELHLDSNHDDTHQMQTPSSTDNNAQETHTSSEPSAESTLIASDSDSDSEGWITPSNLKKRQAEDEKSSTLETLQPKSMQVAVLTTDFAMQNVLLQINLNLLSPSLTRVKHLKTFVLRCHACFQVSKDMTKQFCPRCGQPTLSRVSCSTNLNGEFKLHLKKNMQWNTRGDKYSIPKPVHGSANGRIKGGGKNGWGHELILAEDQKEYTRAASEEKRRKERTLMDEDYLPDLLTGHRSKQGGRIKVGAGRNVNSKKR